MTKGVFMKARTEGFTLIEIMVALTILAVGILGVVGLFVSAIGGNAQGRKVSEASSLAQSRLDYLMNGVPYKNLDLEPMTDYNINALGRKTLPSDDPQLPEFYNLTSSLLNVTSISYNNVTSAVDMYKITVTCYWVSKNRRHEVTLKTFRAEE